MALRQRFSQLKNLPDVVVHDDSRQINPGKLKGFIRSKPKGKGGQEVTNIYINGEDQVVIEYGKNRRRVI